MAYKFTKLFTLDTVNKVGSYAFKKLSTNGYLFLELSLEGDILTMYGMNEGVSKTITIYDDITPVTSISGVTGMSVTYDLSQLNLAAGEHYISAQVSAEGYIDSALVTVTYTVIPSLTAPTIELDEDTLNIYDDEGIATSYDILVDGEVVDTVEAEVDTNFLTFSSPSTFTLGVADNTKYWDGSLEYSTDAKTWNTWSGTSAISSSADGKLYMRGTGNTVITGSTASATIARWVLTGSDISCSGNIETLLDYATVKNGEHPTMADSCFRNLFRDNTSVISAPELPATALIDNCYRSMFYGCTALTIAPALPATVLSPSCYMYMFARCENLVTLPRLPATVLSPSCYMYMFYYCIKIKMSKSYDSTYKNSYRIPSSGTGTTATDALTSMFVTNNGAPFTGEPSINTTYYTSNTVV